MTDSAGTSSLTRKFDPWGNLLQGATAPGYAFTGREWESETNLYYYRARYYSAATGRFLSEDPAMVGKNSSDYAYVRNNPIALRDPEGLTDMHALDDGAIQAMRTIWGRCQRLLPDTDDEYCGNICECPDGTVLWGKGKLFKSGSPPPSCGEGKLIGAFHCHPPGWRAAFFSDEDQYLILWGRNRLKVIYLLTPEGYMKKLTTLNAGEVLGRLQPFEEF